MDKVEAYWAKHFPSMAPVGWDLRSSLPDRWVRFHSLPGSKRYPESKKDRAIVAERATALAKAVLGDHGPFYLLAYVYEPDPDLPFTVTPQWRYHGAALTEAFRGPEDSEDDAATIVVFTGEVSSLGKPFEEAVLGIAEERSARALWVSPKVPAVFAPYDGGFDIITAKPQDIPPLRQTFKKWLSKHPEGL
jgi:hypothetical protein